MKRCTVLFAPALVWALCFAATHVAKAHPSLYFQAGDLPSLQARTQDDATNALGYDFASVFSDMMDRADSDRSTPCTYTVQIPNPDGSGSVEWSYTVSAAMPPGHPNNPSYPVWTGLSRLIQRRIERLAFAYAMTGDYLAQEPFCNYIPIKTKKRLAKEAVENAEK